MKAAPLSVLLAACAAAPPPAPPVSPGAPTTETPPSPAPVSRFPATPRGDVVEVVHGVSIADPYRWLEDVSSPEVQAWMAAQDERTRDKLASLPAREGLAKRFRELFMVDSAKPPVHEGSRWFHEQQHADKDKAILYVREGRDGKDEVLFDPNTMSQDGSLTLGYWKVSPSGRYVAYRVSKNNSDSATLMVRDLSTGKDLPDVIEGARYAYPAWLPDDSGFYYVALPTDGKAHAADLPARRTVRFHPLGAPPAQDPIVVPAITDPSVWLIVEVSGDGHWLWVSQASATNTDVRFKDLRRPQPAVIGQARWEWEREGWKPLAVATNAQYEVKAHKDRFYVRTDEGASRWRVFSVDPKKPARAAWKEIVAERADATLRGIDIYGGQLVLEWLRNVHSELEIRRLDGRLVRTVELPGVGSLGVLEGNADDKQAYFEFSSFVAPKRVYELSLETGAVKIWKDVQLPISVDDIVTEQVEVTSKDGTKLPMFLVHKKGLVRDGSNPVYLHGYGGFNIVKAPEFMPGALVFVEHGGVFALPSLRGGGEFGEAWHQAGMLGQKQNVFDDFIAAAEWLVKEKVTSSDKLVIWGRSNGGLLVGAAMTQRPDLFKAVVCTVPLLDMVRFHLSGSGATWTDEYGSAADPEQFKWLLAYSPLHRIERGVKYPALLMESSDTDDRVEPLHARKFVAALQHAVEAGDTPVWLRIERQAGHAGADSLRQKVDMWADHFAFVFDQLGMK